MVHAMRALSNSAETLLSVMEVFINEPLLDWNKQVKSDGGKSNAAKQSVAKKGRGKKAASSAEAKEDDAASASPTLSQYSVSSSHSGSFDSFASADARGELQWLPHRKIMYAREKLNRGNPAAIMLQEYRDSAHFRTKPAAKQIEACISGSSTAGSGPLHCVPPILASSHN